MSVAAWTRIPIERQNATSSHQSAPTSSEARQIAYSRTVATGSGPKRVTSSKDEVVEDRHEVRCGLFSPIEGCIKRADPPVRVGTY